MALSSTDIDRDWSRQELEGLSPGQLTWLTWRKHYRNAAFFGPALILIYFVSQLLGAVGVAIGWAGLLFAAVLAVYHAVGVFVLLLVLVRQPNLWKLTQSGIVAASAVFYGALAIVLWSGLR